MQRPQQQPQAAPQSMRYMSSGGAPTPQQQQQSAGPNMTAHRRPFMSAQMQQQQMASGGQPQAGRGLNFGGATAGGGGRKRRRFADRVIAPEIRTLVPEADAYMGLLTYEQKLDALISRKKLEIQEALKRPVKIKRKLRIYVSHSFIAGKEPEREGDEGIIPMWELRVEGRLLDEQPPATGQSPTAGQTGSNSAQNAQQQQPRSAMQQMLQPKRKFSSFFKSLVIELDKNIYGPDNHLVEWHRTPTTGETDGFQVKRPGNMDVKCTILLLLDHQPMKFKLHPRLAKLLGIPVETRQKIIEALWQYIKTHKLQDPVDHDVINCDHYLEQVFNCQKMRFMEVPQRLQQLLQQPDPLVIHHVIKWDAGTGASGESKNTACYDIDVELDDPVKQMQSNFLHSNANIQEIMAYDQKIFEIVDNINELKQKRDFFAGFAESPQDFVEKWLVSQSKDLKTLSEGGASDEYELERRAEKYSHPDVGEGIYRYIYGKVQQKRFELEATLGIRNN